MATFKDLFFKYSSPISRIVSFPALLRISGSKIFIPFYHIVSDKSPAHVRYLYPVVKSQQFAEDIDFILKTFKPVDLKELIDITKTNREIKKPIIHFTFDDGFKEFSDIAAPILLKKGVPATCFLNTDFIDNKGLLFRCKASLLIDKLHHETAGSAVWKKYHEFCSEHNIPKVYYRNFLLSIGYDKKDMLDKLANALDYDFNNFLTNKKPYLSTQQIRQLQEKGFTFGAHSIDHPNYRFLSDDEKMRQTKESIDIVCSKFNLDYRAFSFPFTDFELSQSFFDTIYKNDIAEITFGCSGIKKDSATYNLHRFSGETEKPGIKSILSQELLYFLFLKMTGKQKINRR